MLISVGGNIMLSSYMPGSLAGKYLNIETFTIDTSPSVPEIVNLKAGVDIPSMMLFNVQLSNVYAGIEWDRSKKDGWLDLSGAMTLPGIFPAFLAGQVMDISDFRISLSGKTESFSASFSTNPGVLYDAFGYIQMSDVYIGAGLENGVFYFDGAGTILLPHNRFPEGIGGMIMPVSMTMNSQSGLTALSADAFIPGGKLFGALSIQGGTIGIRKNENGSAVISIGGRLLLPDNFPEGLRGVSVTIWSFKINTEGKIIDLDIGASGIESKLFGAADLSNGRIAFETGLENEFIVGVSGRVKLSSRLPNGLAGKELLINTLILSTRTGLISCEVGLNSGISFVLPGQIKIDVYSLFLNAAAITVSASASLPSYYPPGLANTRIDLRVLTIDWNGRLLDIQGGLGFMNLELAGFSAVIESLYFEKDYLGRFWIVLDSCRLRFPAFMGTLGGQYIGINNTRFNLDTGAFMGDIDLPRLQTEIAGFRLVLDGPVIEFTEQRIKFAKVTLLVPDFIGSASISLNGLKISARAIESAGAGFRLPSFSIGGLRFSNIGADFAISDSQYIISGQGSVLIPGAGQIYAKLAFANRSETYPIGLKQAEFSYQIGLGGIPLGSTGLFLSGISGGIAYGPPNDLPQKVQGMFQPKGPRIKLGLYVTDYSGGQFITMNPETWVDISNPAWAFSGNAAVLKGTLNINSNLLAATSGAGFYGGMDIQLNFVRGSVEVYIFDKNGKVVFSGEGHVSLGLKKGAILKQQVLFLTVHIPPSDIWLAKIGAEFGLFTNGKTGFKGYVELPILGTVGVFVAPGTFAIGGVSSYTIEKPNWTNIRFSDARRFSMSNPGIIFDNAADLDGLAGDTGISSLYTVFIPKKPDSLKIENGLERIVFLLSYIEGEPGISVTAPSGIEYREGDDHTETVYMENVMAFIIHSPEAGIWQIKVSDIEEGLYELSALGSEAPPSITVTEPVSGTFGETLTVKGTTDAVSSKIRIRAREDREKPAFDLGSYPVNKDGTFAAEVSLEMIPDGEYLVSLDLVTKEDEVSPAVYVPGKIRIDRSALPLYEPEPVRAAETDNGTVTLRWQNNNGMRTSGYLVRMKNITDGTESVFNTGNITSIIMPGFSDGEEFSFEVASVDTWNRTSSYSSPMIIKIGDEKPEINRPVVSDQLLQFAAAAGDYIEGNIHVSIPEYQDVDDASGYILARLIGGADNGDGPDGRLIFEGPVKVERKTAEISWRLHVPENQNPGIIHYSAEVINEANSSLRSPFTLEISVSRPQPEIRGIEPDEFDGSTEQTLTIHGRGFVPGTGVWYRGKELSLTGRKDDFSAVRIEVILPAQEEAGEYPVMVIGPDGKSAEYPVQVYLPGWYGTLHTRMVETVPGGNADYWISINGVNGFEGTARFTLVEKPDELEVFLPEISEGSTGLIQIRVNGNARPGTYRTCISGGIGKTFEIETVVGDKPPPHLTGFSPSAVYCGTEVHVYGYGLGRGGEIRLNGLVVPFSLWTESRIVFTVPDDAKSGLLQVTTDKMTSNALSFTIRNRGFSIKPSSNRIDLTAGETRTVEMFLTGYADIVELRAEIETGAPVTATLDKNTVIPNAAIRVTVNAGINAGNGTWKMRIVGTSRDYETYAEFTVCIGDVFTVNAAELPEAIAGASYYAKITSQNSRGKVTYRLTKGELPAGLDLGLSGEIQGRPQKTGLYRVEIEGQDETTNLLENSGEPLIRVSSETFVIEVREEIWGQSGKDGGKTRSANTDLPSDNETAFTYRLNEEIDCLLAAEEQVIIVSESGITAIHSATGKLSWAAKGPYREVRYAGGKIYALTENYILEARDLSIGTLLYTREGIGSFTTDDVTILAESGSAYLVLDAARGTLKERIPKRTESDTSAPERILWKNGAAFIIGENRIAPVRGTAPAWRTGETIITAAMDSQGASVITENALFILDRDFRELVKVTRTFFAETQLALSGSAVLSADRNGVYEYDRKTGDLKWRHNNSYTTERDRIAVGKDKAAAAGNSGLAVLNRTSGELIWGDDKPYRTLALYRERIYAADAEGIVYAYSGPPNRDAPETTIQLWPESPDGTNGWYKTAPMVKVVSKDRETFIAETKLFIDGIEVTDPEDFVTLEDGEHQIIAYSTDSQGLQSNTVRLHIKVDTVPPISDYMLPDESPVNTWYTAPVMVTLEGWDESGDLPPGSGMDRILTNLGTYTGKSTFSQSGIHDFSWQAVDRAGNRERLRHLEIKIDIEPPVVEGRVFYDKSITEAVISAADLVSGLGVIEYTVNGGSPEIYHEPLTFTEEGLYHIKYRAGDRAGNYSEWNGLDVWVSPGMQEASLIESASINGKERLVVANIRNGLPLIRPEDGKGKPGFDRTKPEALLNLPRYVLGGEYLFWEQEDIRPAEIQGNEPGSIRFRLSTDTAVYLFLPHDIEAPSGFSFVEGNRMINRTYFPGGTQVYMKRFIAGSHVELPAAALTKPGAVPPLIVAQELGNVFAEITVREAMRTAETTGDTVFEAGSVLIPEAVISPWQYSRRLPLRERWAVNAGEDWIPLEENLFEVNADTAAGFLRFRLELYTPDGQVEYKAEKTIGIVKP
jgi:outer membrane protein assembly factor BamB